MHRYRSLWLEATVNDSKEKYPIREGDVLTEGHSLHAIEPGTHKLIVKSTDFR